MTQMAWKRVSLLRKACVTAVKRRARPWTLSVTSMDSRSSFVSSSLPIWEAMKLITRPPSARA